MEKESKDSALFEWLYTATTFHSNALITDYLPDEIWRFIFADYEEEGVEKDLSDMDKKELEKYKEIFSYDIKISDVFTKRGLRIARKNGIRYRKAVGCIGLITLWDLCEFLESFEKNPELNAMYLWRETQKISPFESGEIEPHWVYD